MSIILKNAHNINFKLKILLMTQYKMFYIDNQITLEKDVDF